MDAEAGECPPEIHAEQMRLLLEPLPKQQSRLIGPDDRRDVFEAMAAEPGAGLGEDARGIRQPAAEGEERGFDPAQEEEALESSANA
jgi:hypothetical protein